MEDPLEILHGKSKFTKDISLLEPISPLITWLIGSNGGLAGADMRILQKTDRKTNIAVIDDYELTCLDVMTAAALFDSHKGPVIGIFLEYAHLGNGRSIHAAGQLEWFNCIIDGRSKVVGGDQRIEMTDGYLFPLSIESGLVYIHPIQAPTDDKLQKYPYVFFTSPGIWDASVLYDGIVHALLEEIRQEAEDSMLEDSMCDGFEDLHQHQRQHLDGFWAFHVHLHQTNPAEEDWKSLGLYFGWQSE